MPMRVVPELVGVAGAGARQLLHQEDHSIMVHTQKAHPIHACKGPVPAIRDLGEALGGQALPWVGREPRCPGSQYLHAPPVSNELRHPGSQSPPHLTSPENPGARDSPANDRCRRRATARASCTFSITAFQAPAGGRQSGKGKPLTLRPRP